MSNTLDELCEIAREIFLADYADMEPQTFFIPVNPVPASRPRPNPKGGVAISPSYKRYKEQVVGPCNSFCGRKSEAPRAIACFIEHVVQKPQNPSNPYPKGDFDNYDKAPIDAMVHSGLFWTDDVQIVFAISVKRYTKPNEDCGCHVIWFDFDM